MIQNQWTTVSGDTKQTDLLKGRSAVPQRSAPSLESHFGQLLSTFRNHLKGEAETGDAEVHETLTGIGEPVADEDQTLENQTLQSESSESAKSAEPEEVNNRNQMAGAESGGDAVLQDASSSDEQDTDAKENVNEAGSSGLSQDTDHFAGMDSELTEAAPAGDEPKIQEEKHSEEAAGNPVPDKMEVTDLSESEPEPDRESETEPESLISPDERTDMDHSDSEERRTDGNPSIRNSREGLESAEERNSDTSTPSGSETNRSGSAETVDRPAGERSGLASDGDSTVSSSAGTRGDSARVAEQTGQPLNENPESAAVARDTQTAAAGSGPSNGADKPDTDSVKEEHTDNRRFKSSFGGKAPSGPSPDSSGEHFHRPAGDKENRAGAEATVRERPPEASVERDPVQANPAPARESLTDSRLAAVNRSVEIASSDKPETVPDRVVAERTETTVKGLQLRNLKAEQIRAQRTVRHLERFSNRGEAGSARSGNNLPLNESSQLSQATPESPDFLQGITVTEPDEEMSAVWQELAPEMKEIKEKRPSESQPFGMARLGQIPVSNITIRRNLLPGLTQSVLKAAGANSGSPESWQKHHIEIEKGKNVQISVRRAEGVLQLRIGSSNPELNKLMQQHQHEIRQHLEEECGLEVELQFDTPEEGGLAQFFDGTGPGRREQPGQADTGRPRAGRNDTIADAEDSVRSLRKFGYNQMEWTI